MPETKPLTFELQYRKEAYNQVNGVMVRNEERDIRIPEVPTGFKPETGFHGAIAARADRLNSAQSRSGYMDYFFFPDLP